MFNTPTMLRLAKKWFREAAQFHGYDVQEWDMTSHRYLTAAEYLLTRVRRAAQKKETARAN